MSPFDIRPAVFELAAGGVVYLEVMFSPQAVTSYSQELTMVCDNCQVKHFTITG